MVVRLTSDCKFLILLTLISGSLLLPCRINAQTVNYNYFYRVYFRDKGNLKPSDFNPSNLLSVKAQLRREKAGIQYPVISDLPLNSDYINQIRSRGFTFHCGSKWLNTGLFKSSGPLDISALLSLPFVRDVKIVKKPVTKGLVQDKLDLHISASDYPSFDRPLTMLEGQLLHSSGFTGEGVMIAVLDGGFAKADKISSLQNLRNRKGIKGTWDMIQRNSNVYDYHYHGTAVLSILAGEQSNYLEGSAPGADYWLIRTEDTSSEFPVEEDYWVAGAELADSLGADIISSSLGYFNFDDQSMNYKFSQMDGKSAFVTQGADFAASKGILVVNSAGNERTTAWKRIIAPTDGDSVLSAGAVDGYNKIADFSSAGPSADRRIKPDNVAQGVNVVFQIDPLNFVRGNGTSFSCPVLSGMCACLMQAVPKALNVDIIEVLRKNGDRYNNPDSLYGYGIPDMNNSLKMLQDKYVIKPDNELVIGPNPFTTDFTLTLKDFPESLNVMIFNSSGKLITNKWFNEYSGRTVHISELQKMPQGIYFVRVISPTHSETVKAIKISKK